MKEERKSTVKQRKWGLKEVAEKERKGKRREKEEGNKPEAF